MRRLTGSAGILVVYYALLGAWMILYLWRLRRIVDPTWDAVLFPIALFAPIIAGSIRRTEWRFWTAVSAGAVVVAALALGVALVVAERTRVAMALAFVGALAIMVIWVADFFAARSGQT